MIQIESVKISRIIKGESNFIKNREPAKKLDENGGAMFMCRRHRWELLGNYPVFTMVMVIYHYFHIIVELSLPLIFSYNIYDCQLILSRCAS